MNLFKDETVRPRTTNCEYYFRYRDSVAGIVWNFDSTATKESGRHQTFPNDLFYLSSGSTCGFLCCFWTCYTVELFCYRFLIDCKTISDWLIIMMSLLMNIYNLAYNSAESQWLKPEFDFRWDQWSGNWYSGEREWTTVSPTIKHLMLHTDCDMDLRWSVDLI